MTKYVGPCEIECSLKCAVPDGVKMTEVPRPRHNWGDVLVCPHDECGRAFLVSDDES
jgi:hypothetical protein